MRGMIGALLVAALVTMTGGCAAGWTYIASSPQDNECGEFSAMSAGSSIMHSAGNEFGKFGHACWEIQSGKADAAYVASLRGAANYYARQEGADSVDQEARKGVYDLSLAIRCKEGDVEACEELGAEKKERP